MKYFENELSIMRELDHPNVVKFVEIFVSSEKFYIVMEYLRGKNLREYVKEKGALSENEAKVIFFQICKAINYLHTIGIAHRDIKLENCLFKDTQ